MAPGGYNSGYQFVQSPGWMMILIENNHIARMIPTDGRPGLPQNVRGWTGISRGHWEGNTLVVQTTNITTDLSFPGNAQPAFWYGISENMKVTEWFTRVDANTINYKFTVDDPATWTRPWTAGVSLCGGRGPDIRACVPRGQSFDDQRPHGRPHGREEGRRSREKGIELDGDFNDDSRPYLPTPYS